MQRITTAVLLDLDDTLVDHLGASRAGLAAIQREVGQLPDVSAGDLERVYNEILLAMHNDVVHGLIDRQQAPLERLRRFFRHYGCEAADPEIVTARRVYREAYLTARQAVPGAHALLSALHGRVKIGVVTDNIVAEQVEKLRLYDMTQFVDELVVSQEVGVSKPDPKLFRVALERLDCVAENTVMVGDSWDRDVLGACGVGIRAVWLNRHGSACPDASLATEILSLEPTDRVVALLLGCQ